MSKYLDSSLPTWETQIEFQFPSSGLAQPQLLQAFGAGKKQLKRDLFFLSFSLSSLFSLHLSNKMKVNK